jgi:hypothetical protein
MRRFRSVARLAWRRAGYGATGRAVALAATFLVFPAAAAADGRLTRPTVTPVGNFGWIEYVQYDGIFAGETSTGAYRVPYRVTAPAKPKSGNRTVLVDRGITPRRCRFYAEAGAPHIPDFLVPFPSNQTTLASDVPALRAHFMQADRWVQQDKQPPPTTHLLPFVELVEARYIADFFGSYGQVRTIAELGFQTPTQYLEAFAKKLNDYVKADAILNGDADAMLRRAGLCPASTFTQTYRDHYDEFVAINPCGI